MEEGLSSHGLLEIAKRKSNSGGSSPPPPSDMQAIFDSRVAVTGSPTHEQPRRNSSPPPRIECASLGKHAIGTGAVAVGLEAARRRVLERIVGTGNGAVPP